MKIFMSWSGDLSRKLGQCLYNWIPSVLQYAKPYFTPEDIKKGERWGNEISRELTDSEFGVFCVTNDNLNSQWMLFEAGAISKKLDTGRVCPILFNVKPTDLTGPLQQFQATTFVYEDIKRLLNSINEQAKEQKLADSVFNNVFDKWWPDVESEINVVLSAHKSTSRKQTRTDRELLEEILTHIRTSAKSNADFSALKNDDFTRINSSIIRDLMDNFMFFYGLLKMEGTSPSQNVKQMRVLTEMVLNIQKLASINDMPGDDNLSISFLRLAAGMKLNQAAIDDSFMKD